MKFYLSCFTLFPCARSPPHFFATTQHKKTNLFLCRLFGIVCGHHNERYVENSMMTMMMLMSFTPSSFVGAKRQQCRSTPAFRTSIKVEVVENCFALEYMRTSWWQKKSDVKNVQMSRKCMFSAIHETDDDNSTFPFTMSRTHSLMPRYGCVFAVQRSIYTCLYMDMYRCDRKNPNAKKETRSVENGINF